MSFVTALLTAEEYARLDLDHDCTELVRGRVVVMNPPYSRHGQVCWKVARIVGVYVDDNELGHFLSNDSGVITERDPDTVRGADLAFYSYAKVPRGRLPVGYLPVPPDLVFEVRSPSERRGQVLAKVAEYLEAGVAVVCVLDEPREKAEVYRQDQSVQVLAADEDLTFPDLLGEFRVRVGRFFE